MMILRFTEKGKSYGHRRETALRAAVMGIRAAIKSTDTLALLAARVRLFCPSRSATNLPARQRIRSRIASNPPLVADRTWTR